MRTLAVIPARAGSKGVPGKNKRLFHGKPLVSWSVEVGLETCDRVCVSTDDPFILETYPGLALERPFELATDETPMVDVLKHVLACQMDPVDVVVLLQPTSPLRTALHVRRALWLLEPNLDSVVSVVQIPEHMSPDFACKIEAGRLSFFLPGTQVTNRQACRPAYYRDGTVYVLRPEAIRQGKMYRRCLPMIIPAEESCTIDTEADWRRAEEMYGSSKVV